MKRNAAKLLFTTLFTFFEITDAQSYIVQGKVLEYVVETPIKYAKITFIDQSDTTKQYTTTTDTSGYYQISIVTNVKENKPSIPSDIELAQNYPNPFSLSTAISYKLNKPLEVSIKVFDILGREIKSFLVGSQKAGTHDIRWNGRDNFGNTVTPGVYFYRLHSGNETQVKKMLFGFGSSTENFLSGSPLFAAYTLSAQPGSFKEATTEIEFLIKIENTVGTTPEIMSDYFSDVVEKDTTMNFYVCLKSPSICLAWDWSAIDYASAWSPDGKTIAYSHSGTPNTEDSSGIYLIDADGKNKRLWYAGLAEYPSWSPDGEWIVLHNGGQIYKRKFNGDSLTQLTFEGSNFFPDWSSVGEWITYDRSLADYSGPAGIWIMKPDGSQKKGIFGGAFPTWHPNSESLLGVIGASPTSVWTRFVHYYPFQSTPSETLSAVIGSENKYPKYSPDGTKIAFTSSSSSSKSQIWVINADGTNLQKLTKTQGYTCDWSPDGEWIVYTDSRFINGRLWIMRKDGTERRQITF